jgi:tRNA (guanine-N7-)-methyltransferase
MRAKLQRFAEIEQMPNVIQEGKPLYENIKGRWGNDFFKNDNPIVVELGCGRGEYTVGLARVEDHMNYIGVDVKGDRLWRGAKTAMISELNNVGFLRTEIRNIDQFFVPGEVAELWLIFPDPRPKDKDEKHRLSNNNYLCRYRRIIKPGGWFKLKTDDAGLFGYTLKILQNRNDIEDLIYTDNLYDSPLQADHYGILTRYEKKFIALGKKIKYLKFKFR